MTEFSQSALVTGLRREARTGVAGLLPRSGILGNHDMGGNANQKPSVGQERKAPPFGSVGTWEAKVTW